MTRIAPVILLVLVGGSFGAAQHRHSSQPAQASHHAFLEMERQAIERGEGFGMAMPADRSGYPGPKHVLELKEELKLTLELVAAMEKLFAEMKQKALDRGRELLNAEQRLEQLFAEGRSEDELREETYRIASLRAELRWVHLRTHLATRRLLTPQQVEAYTRIRHGAAAASQPRSQ